MFEVKNNLAKFIVNHFEAYEVKDDGWFRCKVCHHPSEPNVDQILTYRRHSTDCVVGKALRTLHSDPFTRAFHESRARGQHS